MSDTVLGVFLKNPQTQRVKSRLAQSTSELFARAFYNGCLDCLRDQLKELANDTRIVIVVSDIQDVDWAREAFGLDVLPQRGCDLGQRLTNAFADLFEGSNQPRGVMIMGSDSPTLPTRFIRDGLSETLLKGRVLGPTVDGGFYSIGSTSPLRFDSAVRWSSPFALEDVQRFLGPFHLMATWHDIDTREDLAYLFDPLFRIELQSEPLNHLIELAQEFTP